jgi:hypothetical protein
VVAVTVFLGRLRELLAAGSALSLRDRAVQAAGAAAGRGRALEPLQDRLPERELR